MGTIAQKLEYLNDTRLLLKDNINKINNVLDDNSTFRSYPQELFNGYLDILNNGTDTLWNNLEKVSASGEEATLENVETAPIKMVLNGNTSQDGTPTPDTPVEVKVVKGNNVVSVQGKNLLDTSMYSLGSINGNTGQNEESSSVYRFDKYNEVKPNTTIYLLKHLCIYFYNENKGFISSNITDNLTITTPPNTKYIRFRIFGADFSAFNPNDYMVSYTQETDFVPYSKTDYPINLVSKNLFSTENLVNATITDTGEYIAGDNRIACDYAKLNTSYQNLTLSFIFPIGFMGVAFYDENKQYLSRNTANDKDFLVAQIPENAEYCRAFFQFGYDKVGKVDAKIVQQLETQLEYGTERTNYVSYFTPIELCKINTYKDFPFKAINGNEYYDTLTEEQKNALNYGSWYVHKEINKVVFDGSESWIERRNADNVKQFRGNKTIRYVGTSNQFCNYGRYNSIAYNFGRVGQFVIATDYIYLCVDDNAVLEDFKTTIATNNLIGYYSLTTPTEEEITNTTLIEQLEAIYKAKSVKDKTYITQTNDDLPFILDVEAIKEYEVV